VQGIQIQITEQGEHWLATNCIKSRICKDIANIQVI